MSLLIYSEKSSPRLEYILDFIFSTVIPCDYSLTHDFQELLDFSGGKINYSTKQPYPSLINIIPLGLLDQDNLQEYYFEHFDWDGLPAFFKTSTDKIPHDIFSASFFLISRYEEYLTNKLDEFQRFPHEESIAFINNFLQQPLLDQWAMRLKKILLAEFPTIIFHKKQFHFLPTYDIDIAYSYLGKGALRNIGGMLKDLSKGELGAVKNRISVLRNVKQDPFDSFDYLDNLHKEKKLSPIYFFLLGSGGKLDKNISVKNLKFRSLIKQIAKKYEVGIHPSYKSNDVPGELNKEIQHLHKIAYTQAAKSRQHYIRFALPYTYQNLLANGIKEDYSMGYGSINGFRASTSHSFYWFDLSTNKKTTLKIFPFCFMECNSFFEQKQNIAQTQTEIEHYISVVKKVEGTLISIWHNFSLGTDPQWAGWQSLYKKLIHEALR